MLSACIVRVTPPRCAGCVTPHRGSVTEIWNHRDPLLRGALLGELAPSGARGPLCARAASRRRQAPHLTRYSGEPYSANSPPRGREVVCAHGLRPEGGSRRTWQHGAVQLSAPPALLQSGLPSMGARTNPCLLARVLTRTSAYSHACLLARPIPPTQLGSVLSLVLPAPQTAHRSRYATFACATFLVLLAYGVRYGILSKKMYIPTSSIHRGLIEG